MHSLCSSGSKRILLVDDEKHLRDILEQVLVAEGFQVQTAADGGQALDLAKANHYDLFIIDLIMPGKEGIETILELRTLDPLKRIIAMSGGLSGGGGDFLPLAKALGASAVLRKPFDRKVLIETVETTLAGDRRRVLTI